MSTRSYIGIIQNGMVKYGYHHSSSYLEGLGIELFNIKTEKELAAEIDERAEFDTGDYVPVDDYFKIPAEDIFIEFCYGFNVDDNKWYVSSCHFTKPDEMHELTEVVRNDKEMNYYLDQYYERYQEEILNEIRDNIKWNK